LNCLRLSLALLLALGLLSGCASMRPGSADLTARNERYLDRQQAIEAVTSWSLEGRLAVRDENDGGSGHFRWKQSDEGTRMDFHGAMGRGAWRLVADAQGAVLELSDGSSYRARTVDELVRKRLGWVIPVDALASWVKGIAAPGEEAGRELDEAGNLLRLDQRGWVIDYGRYRVFDQFSLPSKMTARQEARYVKLAVKDWKVVRGNE
jgi:outer membrane lipoprotein LolB